MPRYARTFALLAAAALSHSVALFAAAPAARLNVLFITSDDMNHDSVGCYGGQIKDLTPHIDRLAAEGMRFHYA